ncbi:YraN family protein [Brachybacterium vulturis]|uniref:YraN family protein n=1 Tax=Brachybacterium vulturis TaxID=2017484 RepID=UPI003736C97D
MDSPANSPRPATGPSDGAHPVPLPGAAAAPPPAGPVAAPPPRRVRDMTTGELGRAGEDLAAAHLGACGWQIVERNLRLRHGELDIVALAHTTLVFVEVKTRRSFVTGVPQAAVTPDKLRRLRRLAGAYLMERSTPHRDVRIDVVAVHAHPDGTFAIEHLEAVS